MTLVARVRTWIRAALRRSEFERGMDDEMRAHMELYEADLRGAGVAADEARRRARAEFGSIAARQEECRQAFGLRLLDELGGDVRYALRLLARSPAFTAVALLSLALGIGANTAIFSLVDTVLVKTLPVQDPQQLFFVDNTGGKSGGSNGPPYPCYERFRDHNRYLSGIAAFDERLFKVTIDGRPERVRGQVASGAFFDVLGVQAAHGRLLTIADDSVIDRGGPDGAVAVISHGYWERRFGKDPAILGRSIQVGTHWVTIVGVTEPGFLGLQVGAPTDITIPMMLAGGNLREMQTWWLSVIGRLRPDATVEQARADLDAMFETYLRDAGSPRDPQGYFSGITLVPASRGANGLRRDFSEPLLIVMGIVAVVLLIGCTNVASLLLSRAGARGNEIAVRLAIGASRGRLIRQLLTEGAVLALLGALAGLVFARWAVSFPITLLAGPGDRIILDPAFDARVLAFTAATAIATSVLFSLAPARRATRVDAARPDAGRTVAGSRSRAGIVGALTVVQITLSLVLLSAAALFVRTLGNLHAVDAGFDREGVLTLQVEATVPGRTVAPTNAEERRRDHARLGAMWLEAVSRVAAVPGVSAAAVATLSPLSGRDRGVRIAVSGGAPIAEREQGIHVNQVSPRYLETVGVHLVSGRSFSPSDRAGSPRVAIINETAARTYFGGANPIGRLVKFPGQRVEDEYEIVGVVRDTRYKDLRTPDERMVYLPIEQAIDPITSAIMIVRTAVDTTSAIPAIRRAAESSVPGGFATGFATIEERIRASLVRERLLMMLASFFAGLALTLACVGLYGMMAYTVTRRTRELGIRLAIGAQPIAVTWMVLRQTLALILAGATLGLAAAVPANRLIAGQLFNLAPSDPAALGAAVVLLFIVAAAAAYLPARRASRINPVIALRYE